MAAWFTVYCTRTERGLAATDIAAVVRPAEVSQHMKWWSVGGCLVMAYVAVPMYVYWLRHRPHRLTEGTQHIVLLGQLAQLILVGLAVVMWWLA